MTQDLLQKLPSLYKELTPFEQLILEILAISYAPLSQDRLLKILRKADVPPDHTGLINMQDFRRARNRLSHFKLVKPSEGKGIQCAPVLVDELMLLAYQKPYFKELIHSVQQHSPLSPFMLVDYQLIVREIRIGLYTHDFEHLQAHIERGMSHHAFHSGQFDPYDVIIDVCSKPGFQRKLFGYLHPDIIELFFYELVDKAILCHSALSDEMHASLAKYGTSGKKEFVSIRELYTLYLIFRGKLKEVEELTKDTFEYPGLMASKGCVAFLKGDNDKAIEIYENALRTLQKNTGKKKYFFPQIQGLFYLLALMKDGSSAKLNQAKDYAQWITKKEEQFLVNACKRCIYGASIAQSNLIHEAKNIVSEIPQYFHKNSLFSLFYELTAYWINEKLTNPQVLKNKALFEQTYENGFYLPALIHGRLLLKHNKNVSVQKICDQLEKQTGIQNIVDSLQQKESWEKALNALIDFSQKRIVSSQDSPSRLIWMVSLEKHIFVSPKVQKINKNGKWSAGKRISIMRLKEGMECMTEHDSKVVLALTETAAMHFGYYGHYYDENYDKGLLALVGHPLVFLKESPSVAVELVKGEPELIVEQTPQGYSLQFSHAFRDTGIDIIKESPSRYKIIEIKEEHVRISSFLGKKKIAIPDYAREKLVKVMSGISSLVTVHSSIEGKDSTIPKIEASSNIYLHLLPVGNGFKLEMLVKPFAEAPPYFNPAIGGKHVFSEIEGKRVQTSRDLSLEKQNAEKIINSCPSLQQAGDTRWTWLFKDNEECLQALTDMHEIRDQMTVEWPEGEKLKIRSVASFQQFTMRIQHENDWFAASGELKLEDNIVIQMRTLLECLSDSSSSFIQLKNGEFIALTEQFRKRLEEINAYSEKTKEGIKFHPLASLALEETMGEIHQLQADKAWEDHLKRLKTIRERNPKIPSTLQAELRDYQEEGFQWLSRLSDWGVGACLSDDMGLGKTIQALTVILERAKDGPALAIAPASVCMNWLSEANRFAPTLNVTFLANEKDRKDAIKRQGSFDLLVSSYGLLQQEEEAFADKEWTTIVLDEGQAIKNVHTKRSKAALKLRGRFKIITTGTPIENHLGELWNLFQFINPGLLGSLKKFNEKYAAPIERDNNHQVKNRLKKLVQPFILRRTKAQVLNELPPKTEITLSIEMSPEESAFYDALRQKAVDRINSVDLDKGEGHLQILAEIMKLRRACCHSRLIVPTYQGESSKLKLFGEVVQELMENHHKALVFSQFVDHLQIIREYLESLSVSYQYLDGSTPIKERKNRVEAFQSGEGELFLISLKAGGLGLNLTAADYVIHMDPWWNPAVEDQASDRAHRIGQQRPVTIYRLVTKGTIEEKIVKLHHEKRKLADSLLEGSDMSGKVSAEQLLQLIREQ
ncbi:MAG: DEAD/DEAH box helicase [Candidatus Brocadiaceae bacterium]|nr:DEAD/DEAH box helicase [Candidatus Brocadiaceae bacterium]